MSTFQPVGRWKNQDERSKDETKKLHTWSPLWSMSHKMTASCHKGWGCNLWLSNHTPAETYKNGEYPRKISSLCGCCSVAMSDSATPWTTACQASLSLTISENLSKFMSIELVMPFIHLILCHPLLLWPSSFPSTQRLGSLHQGAEVLELQLQHQPFQWMFRVDFFTIDYFGFLAIQGTLKSFLQHHSSKASILQHSAFLRSILISIMTAGKTIALTRWTFVSKGMSLLFYTLSRFGSGRGIGKPLQYSCHDNPINSIKKAVSVTNIIFQDLNFWYFNL